MARYDYRCQRCGRFEIACPIGTAPAQQPCAGCGEPAARLLSAPALLPGRTPLARAAEAARRSAVEPAVTAGPRPVRHDAGQPVNPLQAKLPRP